MGVFLGSPNATVTSLLSSLQSEGNKDVEQIRIIGRYSIKIKANDEKQITLIEKRTPLLEQILRFPK